MLEFKEVTEEIHCSLVGSYPMAMEIAAVLIPEAMLIVTGTNTVSPTEPFTFPIVVDMLGPPTPELVTVRTPVEDTELPDKTTVL
jgi:hypothetical protein